MRLSAALLGQYQQWVKGQYKPAASESMFYVHALRWTRVHWLVYMRIARALAGVCAYFTYIECAYFPCIGECIFASVHARAQHRSLRTRREVAGEARGALVRVDGPRAAAYACAHPSRQRVDICI